jgi:hypothetical protein
MFVVIILVMLLVEAAFLLLSCANAFCDNRPTLLLLMAMKVVMSMDEMTNPHSFLPYIIEILCINLLISNFYSLIKFGPVCS